MSQPTTTQPREIELTPGTIRYRDEGHGAPIVFVHGALVNGDLWREVVSLLSSDFRCIAPDLPFGSHTVAMRPDADLTPPALADLIAELIERLDLGDVTLVGNDTGGGLCQILVTRRPERIGRLVLTPSDAFDNFPPKLFHYLLWAARVPGALGVLLQSLRIRALRRTPIAFGWLAKHGIDPDLVDAWVRPVLRDAGVRRDLAKALRGVDPRYTLEAASALARFRKPALLAWAPEDRLFPFAHARRLADILPDARVAELPDAYTFVPLDQPRRLAELISGFVRRPAALSA
jgi:pimeloyl-ACP methyl ester carboxylesterase